MAKRGMADEQLKSGDPPGFPQSQTLKSSTLNAIFDGQTMTEKVQRSMGTSAMADAASSGGGNLLMVNNS